MNLLPETIELQGWSSMEYRTAVECFESQLERPNTLQPMLTETPEFLVKYAYEVLKRRWPEYEHFISPSRRATYHYAKFVVKGRWREAEPRLLEAWCGWFGDYNLMLNEFYPEDWHEFQMERGDWLPA